MFESKYPIPTVTSDAIILADQEILLIKRKEEPFKGMWAFPGGHFDQYESARDCCIRETKEETDIDISGFCPDKPYDIFGERGRDPRGWVISMPFIINVSERFRQGVKVKAGDDADDVKWVRFSDIMYGNIPLAFDHYKILKSYFDWD